MPEDVVFVPGDTPPASRELSRTTRVLTPEQVRLDAAVARLVVGRSQLRQIRNQAQTAADATGALTLAQLTTQHRQLAGAVATLAQTLMDVELVLAHQQDDGVE